MNDLCFLQPMNLNDTTRMNSHSVQKMEWDPALGHTDDVMEPFRKLQRELTSNNETECSKRSEGERSGVLLEESQRIHTCMVDMGRCISDVAVSERKQMHPGFRDEFLHLLVGTHLRLLILANEILSGNGVVRGEIAKTHVILRNSAVILNGIRIAETARP